MAVLAIIGIGALVGCITGGITGYIRSNGDAKTTLAYAGGGLIGGGLFAVAGSYLVPLAGPAIAGTSAVTTTSVVTTLAAAGAAGAVTNSIGNVSSQMFDDALHNRDITINIPEVKIAAASGLTGGMTAGATMLLSRVVTSTSSMITDTYNTSISELKSTPTSIGVNATSDAVKPIIASYESAKVFVSEITKNAVNKLTIAETLMMTSVQEIVSSVGTENPQSETNSNRIYGGGMTIYSYTR